MKSKRTSFRMVPAMLVAASAIGAGVGAQSLQSVPAIPFDTARLVLRAPVEAQKPFTVAGERGVVLGQQDGAFEAWVLPVKLLSHLTIEAEMEGYSVPIDVNQQAAEIEVRPDRTTITYTHIGFTVRQTMFSPAEGALGTGPMVLFEFDCLKPTDFTLRFTPELKWMWPERNEGVPGVEWVPGAGGAAGAEPASGFYVLHSDYPDLAGAVAIPGARPGILAPYQERPQAHAVEFHLHIDPARDKGRLFPLLMAVGMKPETATDAELGKTLAELNAGIAKSYKQEAERWKKFLANATQIDTPDKVLNEAFQWAEVSVEQLRTSVQGTNEKALVAGYYASGDSARPGFGWFFGRDALYTLYAVNGFGDFALSKSELEFLIHRQRADGKIMHEYSQTAAAVDWLQFPYMYAAADSTPLFLLAVEDYVKASGDVGFLTANREAVEKAWAFETTRDSDGDGIYDNAQGTGWVESWPGGMPRQEIYLALLDEQASSAMAEMERLLKDEQKAAAASARALAIAKTIEAEYYDPQKGCYAFATNPAGTANSPVDRTTTVYPALAWWSGLQAAPLAHGGECLKEFAGHALNTDWGLRDVSGDEKIYDGMSYHQGSVWPLFTGWAALAEYRGGQPLAGYEMLMENASLTKAQDLGAMTELLSGDFFVPFGRSTSHQLWSSAMVITPVLRGLFGISIDAQTKTITVNPRLPVGWSGASVKNLSLPGGFGSVYVSRAGDVVDVSLGDFSPKGWIVRSDFPGTRSVADINGTITLKIPLPMLEVDPSFSTRPKIIQERIASAAAGLTPGQRTSSFRILRQEYSDRKLVLEIDGRAGSGGTVYLIRHGQFLPKFNVEPYMSPSSGSSITGLFMSSGARSNSSLPITLGFHFPPGEGWKTITVTLTW